MKPLLLVLLFGFLLSPEILFGRLGTYPTPKTLIGSDIIIVVSINQVEFSKQKPEITVKQATFLKGNVSLPFIIDVTEAGSLWPTASKEYILFLKTAMGKVIPANDVYYALGVNGTPISKGSFSSPESFCEFLGDQLSLERNPNNAAVQAYLINTAPLNLLEGIWKKVKKMSAKILILHLR